MVYVLRGDLKGGRPGDPDPSPLKGTNTQHSEHMGQHFSN